MKCSIALERKTMYEEFSFQASLDSLEIYVVELPTDMRNELQVMEKQAMLKWVSVN